MLNITKPTTAISSVTQEYTSAEQTLQSLKGLISRHVALLVTVVLVCVLLGGVIMLTTPARFTATGLLIIDTKKVQTIQQQAPLGTESPLDTGTVDSQVEILQSETIALNVIKQLRLTELDEFVGPGGGIPGAILGSIRSLLSDGPRSDFELTRKALEKFQKRLSVKRLGLSYVIQIDYQSEDPERAAKIANAVAEAYINDQLESKYQASRRAAIWLQDRLKDLRGQASAAERAVVQYKAENNIVDTGGRLLNEQQLAEINSALTIVRAQKAEAQARLDRINGILQKDKGDGTIITEVGAVADSLHNDVITRLRQQYLDLANREADWSNRYGPQHLAVKNLRDQMREIRRSIGDELKRIAETYKSDLEIASSKEDSTQKTLDQTVKASNDTSQAQIALRELESNAQSYRALADNFLQLYMVSVQQQSFPITEARLITQATPPLKPSYPNMLVVMPGSLVGGIALAFGLAVFRDMSDRAFRTASRVQRELGLDCIAVLPKLSFEGAKSSRGVRGVVARALGKHPADGAMVRSPPPRPAGRPPREDERLAGIDRPLVFRPSPMRYVMEEPFSRFAEGLRAIKLAADLHGSSRTNNVLGITSALPNEGKSSTAASLARVIAHGGTRTLLIDGDLRNPSLTKQLTPGAKAGLVDVISGEVALQDALWTDPETGLDFLPVVIDQWLPHSHEIMLWQSTEKLFASLRASYDRIIVDLPPMAPIVDVRATNRLVDSYLLVVEWGKTKIDVVQMALNDAPNVTERTIGCVLNKANMKAVSRYDLRHSQYYGNSYYSRYGYVD